MAQAAPAVQQASPREPQVGVVMEQAAERQNGSRSQRVVERDQLAVKRSAKDASRANSNPTCAPTSTQRAPSQVAVALTGKDSDGPATPYRRKSRKGAMLALSSSSGPISARALRTSPMGVASWMSRHAPP